MQFEAGQELARQMAAAGVPIQVVATAGPAATLQRLRDDPGPGARLALLQADVGHAYLAAAERGNAGSANWLAPLRVIARLHAESLHFIVRRDAKPRSVQGLRNERINLGPLDEGTALAVNSLYRLLFHERMPPGRASFLGHEQALASLITDRSVDVVAVLADAPARLLANMKPGARRFVRLLPLDAGKPGTDEALRVFDPATIRAADYPQLLAADLPGLSSRVYLVARVDPGGGESLARFMRAWCEVLPRLRDGGHRAWRDVDDVSAGRAGAPPLAPGWQPIEPNVAGEGCR